MRSNLLDVAQLVAHLVRDQEVAGSSPVIQTTENQALANELVLDFFVPVALLSHFQRVLKVFGGDNRDVIFQGIGKGKGVVS